VIRRFFSARVFSLVFGLAYAAAVYGDYPLFRYYPLVSRIALHDLADNSLGPAMSWFGWISTAVIPATLLTAVVPKSIGDRIPAAAFLIATLLMLGAAWYREQAWFLPVVTP
jgi:hypothetical protein